jgi:hypothetical protein
VDAVVLDSDWHGLAVDMRARGWVPVHLDDNLSLFVQTRPDMAAIIDREGYQWLSALSAWPSTPAEAAQLLEEADRALANYPGGADFTWGYKVHALELLGRHEEAAADRHVEALAKARGITLE